MLQRFKPTIARLMTSPIVGFLIRGFFRGNIPNGNLIINVSNAPVRLSTVASIYWGLYESAEIRFIEQYMRRDLDVLELGASIGVVTCHIRRLINVDRFLLAVEANPYLINQIQRNLRINDLDKNSVVINRAVAYGDEMAVLALSKFTTGSRIQQRGRSEHNVVEVPAVKVSDLLAKYTISSPFVLVCDIEGAELEIFYEDQEALRLCQQIIIELHNTSYHNVYRSIDEMCLVLESMNYRLLTRHGGVCIFEKSDSDLHSISPQT